MIVHVILFQPRPDLTGEQRDAVFSALASAARGAPSVRSCRIGRRVKHGLPGYEESMRQDFEFAAVMEFEDVEGLRAYLEHPAHEAIGGHFSTAASSALAYDYEMVSLDEAQQLLKRL